MAARARITQKRKSRTRNGIAKTAIKASGRLPMKASGVLPKKTGQHSQCTVHVIDALPYVFRAYFALPSSIRDPEGRQSNAVVGFANFIMRYIAEEKPTHLAFCFDRSLTSSFRNEIYPDYKSNRSLPPAELKGQIARCRKFAEALGIACFDDKRYEADDLIATLVTSLTASGHKCIVVTSDKDMCQLVGPQVSMYDFAKGERYNEVGVLKKLGVRPSQVIDLLALMGDAVDCIPGVRGIGSKTAVLLLKKFKSLDGVYANLHKVKSMSIRGAIGIHDKLACDRGNALMSRKLASAMCKVPLKMAGLKNLKRRSPVIAKARLHLMLDNYGLSRLHDRVTALA